MGLVHTLPKQTVSCLGTGHWLVDPLAGEQKKKDSYLYAHNTYAHMLAAG